MKIRELRHNLWNIGFIEDGIENIIQDKKTNIHWVKKYINDRWFADPFILDVTESDIVILAEEYSYNLRRGRIARVVIDRKTYEEKKFEIILDLSTHLSFPFIFRYENNIYIMPENSASGSSFIYKYDDETRELQKVQIVSDRPLTDAIIFNYKDKYYLLSTNLPDPNGKTLCIYSFNPKELKVETLLQTVEFNSQVARNAGGIIKINNNLYRPAQDCAKCYGNGVVIQKIEYNEGHFVFKDVNSIYPHSFRYNQGLHTLNNYKGLIVVDGRGYRNLIIGRILSFCFKFIGFR